MGETIKRRKFNRDSKWRGIAFLVLIILWGLTLALYIMGDIIYGLMLIQVMAGIYILEMFYDIYFWIKSTPTKTEWNRAILWSAVLITTIILAEILLFKYVFKF